MNHANPLPPVIQGGMGVAVSNWSLARAVALEGQLGVVSGTAIDTVLVRRLQDGDPGGEVREAIAAFPFPALAQEVVRRFHLPDGRGPSQPYARLPLATVEPARLTNVLCMLGAFVEVHLAKRGHAGVVGINLLAKVQLQTLATLYGAVLAGVDAVLMGAGIPREVPGALDRLARHESASMRLEVTGGGEPLLLTFDPSEFGGDRLAELPRPAFLPIVSSHSLASMLLKRANGSIEGFVVEGPTAGGHNAPPRGRMSLDERGQPLYGERDVADLGAFRELERPFWLAGGTGSPESLAAAREAGAAGVQVGTLFAYCEESGLTAEVKEQVVRSVLAGEADVFTDPLASPTGFPFKVVALEGSNSETAEYESRSRVCDLGYLREIFVAEDGAVGYRCAAEPVDAYVAKGGDVDATRGRKCLCNALLANVGMPQRQRNGELERTLVTSGDDLASIRRLLGDEARSFRAAEVVQYLVGTPRPLERPALAVPA